MKKITHAGTLTLGDIQLPCFVADDGKRLLAGRQFQIALGIVDENKAKRSSGKTRLDRFWKQLDRITSQMNFKDNNEDRTLFEPEIYYRGSQKINAIDARLLNRVCRLILKARREGFIKTSRLEIIANHCEILQSGFAEVGLIALIDEATGYQQERKKNALADILKKWIEQEKYRAWTKTFPLEFYERMFKLKGWSSLDPKVTRPSVVGRYTNDLVYERLAPGLLKELQKKNPVTEKGYRKQKHFQWLTGDVGNPRLKEHLVAVIALMRAATTWGGFLRSLQRAFPKLNTNMELPFDE